MGDKLNLGIRCQDEGVVSIRQSFLAALVCGAWSVFFLMQGVTYANAQGANLLSSSYITPFPQTDRYQVRIIGDWLGTGLTAGLEEAFKPDGSLQITDMSRSNYGLLRAEQAGLYAEVDRMISGPPVHIAIIMMGVNDRLSIRTPTGRIQPGSEEWRDAYGKEAEKLIKKLRGANIAVYWVGLPVMSNPALSEAVAAMNNAVRQTAYLNGAKFIETATGFTDQLGAYSAYGPDLTGQTKRLREGDGVGLTAAGNRKLANYVEIALRRDLAQARAQRNIPLSGHEEEQARVVPGASRVASPKGTVGPDAQPAMAAARPDAGNTKIAARANGVPTFKTETSAPATPPQDAAHPDQTALAGAGHQQGQLILSDLGNGLTAIAGFPP